MRVLVIDDELAIAETIAGIVRSAGHQPAIALNSTAALAEVSHADFDLAFLDIRLGEEDGLVLMKSLLAEQPGMHVIAMTAHANLELAVTAMKQGARDFLRKPFDLAELELVISRIADTKRLSDKVSALESELSDENLLLDSRNEKMQEVLRMAHRVASTDSVILITGESGTGKTQLARAIHGWSKRKDAPFGMVACPTLSAELLASELFGHVRGAFTGAVTNNPGRISRCEGGTLFLDEIGTLPLILQPKLLRFLQDYHYERVGDPTTRKANVRIVAATNADLRQLVSSGLFREDLYYRVNVIELYLPPLRERFEDLENLSNFMLARICQKHGKRTVRLTSSQVEKLKTHSWSGNLRELYNALERALILSGEGEPLKFNMERAAGLAPPKQGPFVGGPFSIEELELAHMESILASSDTVEEAAQILGVNPSTLWRKKKQFPAIAKPKASEAAGAV